ncbi:gamma-glutamylcyclotransferase [Aurantimonas sp. MSK8Z-1]|uniref:gamma-glutamylcyclotransferase n=1 Tax=Mangrovibrevibacter kandeliae TaxID=2968473 RepID=UPI002117910F|nr:gamma-glutamylcyclotransferase [Aurantimonas sp. MSK8Z-1]MCW4114386.1 gamma-glutamylcyclotransferase [Aurantimonas sp. MSK8Z-1]
MLVHEDHPDLRRLLEEGKVVSYFGYGSLVNRLTLRTKFLAIRRARVRGWRRFWMPRSIPPVALLTVRPEAQFETEGVVVFDHADHLPAVDEREAGYKRRLVQPARVSVEHEPAAGVPLFIYEASRDEPTAEDVSCIILQSYLDAVMQGFFGLYGEKGLRRFVDETDGFEAEVLLDRLAPRYPRSVALHPGEAELFDRLLAERGVSYIVPC